MGSRQILPIVSQTIRRQTMKHLFLIAFLFLIPLGSTAQYIEPLAPGEVAEMKEEEVDFVMTNKNCHQGKKLAKRHIARGKLIYLSYGLPFNYDFAYEAFEDQYILENYGVETGLGGCVITPYSDCYQKAMGQAIEKKYGKDFFSRAMKEAQAAFPTSSYFQDNVVPAIEKGEVFNQDHCDPAAVSEMGDEAFKKMIREIILPEKDSLGNYLRLTIFVDRNGELLDWDTRADLTLERRWEIRDALPELKWIPAKYYGTPANCRLEYYIYFDEDSD